MRIIVDENIPAAVECFSQFGDVQQVSGRQLCRADIGAAEVLIVRSVTKVNEALLAGTGVRFVGSTTIGTDHLDLSYLAANEIKVCNAPGSNAESVVDYVISAICSCGNLLERLLGGEPVGIVGYGNVGRRLGRRLSALGIAWRAYDPLLDQATEGLSSLDEVMGCSLVCLHAPLTSEGPYPSYHMLGLDQLGVMPANAVLLNAGRGEVVATEVLLSLCEQRPDISLVLDVWEGEPWFPADLALRCSIATPHIAGYSADGKLTGLKMVASELAAFLNLSLLPFAVPSSMADSAEIVCDGANELDFIKNTVAAVYDVMEDDKRFREIIGSSIRGQAFDLLRKHYPVRRELAYSALASTNPKFSAVLQALQSGR
ncbi:4-phosphoerythronate dehydrogenase [Zhongshania marina]|uniref:4-phosphoerythronate dehydrogenase n=1 Tax=Zhongshania marina TaxID=2304603 RepID=UPI0011AF8A37|nr:4-phosphoerythronate dehydrogenase [Marortus luteolus]